MNLSRFYLDLIFYKNLDASMLTLDVFQLLSEVESRIIQGAAHEEDPVGDTKIFEPVYELKTGLPATAAKGLEDRMCVTGPTVRVKYFDRIAKEVEGIQDEVNEFTTGSSDPEEVSNVQEVKALLNYILFEPTCEKVYKNGIRDHGRGGMTLTDFMENPKATAACLSRAELVAMRLYTTIAFLFMNGPLRDDGRHGRGEPCPLPVTTYFAWNGIKKLRALHVESGEMVLWRGMRNREVANGFMQQGGTELAFMSTTSDLNVAVRYCISQQSLIFKIVSTSFMTMGADVRWLSAFPNEAEILYPPLTYLRPTGRKQVFEFKFKPCIGACFHSYSCIRVGRILRSSVTGRPFPLQWSRSIPSWAERPTPESRPAGQGWPDVDLLPRPFSGPVDRGYNEYPPRSVWAREGSVPLDAPPSQADNIMYNAAMGGYLLI